jgi:non-specific serine/threonine protein kinase
MDNKFTVAYALYGLGKVAEAKGDYATARSYHAEALLIRRETGNRRTIAYSLNALAALAVTQDKATLAARLFGAGEDLQKLIQFTTSPRERAEHDQAIAGARATLGEETFVAAYDEGQKMSLDEAVAYALKEN